MRDLLKKGAYMKTLKKLVVAALWSAGSLSATIQVSSLFVVNKTGKPLMVGEQTKRNYVRNRMPVSGVAVTPSIEIPAGETRKVARLERNQRYPEPLDLTLPHSTTTVEFMMGGQKHLFDSTRRIGAFVSTLTYSNNALKIEQSKLPVEARDKGLVIYSKFVFGKMYHDVYMEVYPEAKYN